MSTEKLKENAMHTVLFVKKLLKHKSWKILYKSHFTTYLLRQYLGIF